MHIHFKTPKGHDAEGELVTHGDGKAPGIVLVQEYWGINAHVKDIAARLAKEGYRVLAPDLYHGTIAKTAAEAGKLMGALDWPRALDEIAGAAEHLRTHASSNGKVGVVGFCLGGALSLAAACNVPHLSGVVAFYGVPDKKVADYTKVTAPILAHFSNTDGWAKVSIAEAIQQELKAQGKAMELCRYDAEHAFFNDTRPEVYSPDNAKLAWERTLAFFKKQLG